MKAKNIKSLIFAVFSSCCVLCAFGATSLFSDYGQIQNVQNYSSNPFWTPNSPYNQRMPQPVYVQGADLNTEDCIKVVQSLVSVQCMARDNCKDTSLSDIRPVVMVQLSNLPGHNYVSACAGYIDGVYESYVAQYGTNVPTRQVAFPTGTDPNPNMYNNQIQIQNPYKQQPSQWQQEYMERSQELQYLQQQNGAGSEHLSATDFPETYADLTFSERMANEAAGYEPYKDKTAYVIPNFISAEEYCPTHPNAPGCEKYQSTQPPSVPNPQQPNNGHNGNGNIVDNPRPTNGDIYYDLRIYSDGKYFSTIYQQKTTNDSSRNLCYAVCGVHVAEDDVNKKVLVPVLNQSFCVPKVSTVAWDTDNFILKSTETGENIKITKEQLPDIIKRLNTIKDSGECDWKAQDITAVIFQHNPQTGVSQKHMEIVLDD